MLFGLLLCVKGDGVIEYDELNQNVRKRKIYLLVTAIQLGLICGLRSSRMAYDTAAYELIFNLSANSWEHIFDKTSYVEVGFRVLCSIVKILGGNYQTLLLITSMFVMGSCCLFIYRHSKDVILSVFIIVCFPFFYSTFDIIRHFLASSFFLIGYKYIVDRKPVRYLIFIILGSLFHSAAWIFLPFYFLKMVKLNWRTVCAASLSTIMLYVYIGPIGSWLSNILGKTNLEESGWIDSYGGGVRTAIMYGVILLIAVIAFLQIKEKNKNDEIAVIYILIMVMCSVVFINARMMTRVMMTMVSLMAIAIPQLFDKRRSKMPRDLLALKLSFIAIGLAYHTFMLLTNWQNVVPYIPYWR